MVEVKAGKIAKASIVRTHVRKGKIVPVHFRYSDKVGPIRDIDFAIGVQEKYVKIYSRLKNKFLKHLKVIVGD